MSENNTPLPAFHFRIIFKGLKGLAAADSGFQSISGLKVNKIPPGAAVDESKTGSAQFNPIVLRRAVMNKQESPLRRWVLKSLHEPSYKPLKEMLIQILNEEHKPGMIFRLTGITAAGWELGALNATESILLMEEISLNYCSVEQIAV